MSIQNFNTVDPFALEGGGSTNDCGVVHVRIQQRNGRKSLTTVQGLSAAVETKQSKLDEKKLLQQWKKDFSCNGNVTSDPETCEKIIQLQGDHREQVRKFVTDKKLVKKDQVKVHGF